MSSSVLCVVLGDDKTFANAAAIGVPNAGGILETLK
jgi:hypothetical protein